MSSHHKKGRPRTRGRGSFAGACWPVNHCAFVLERLEIRRLLSAIVSGQTIAGNILTQGQQDTYTFSVSRRQHFQIVSGRPGCHQQLSPGNHRHRPGVGRR